MKSKYSTEEWQKIIAEYKSTHAVTKITKKYGISKKMSRDGSYRCQRCDGSIGNRFRELRR